MIPSELRAVKLWSSLEQNKQERKNWKEFLSPRNVGNQPRNGLKLDEINADEGFDKKKWNELIFF